MIQLVEPKDVERLFSRMDEINERTKNHTKQIQELTSRIKGGVAIIHNVRYI